MDKIIARVTLIIMGLFLAGVIYIGVVTYIAFNPSPAAVAAQQAADNKADAATAAKVALAAAVPEDCKEEGLYADSFAHQARDLEYSKGVLEDEIGAMRYRTHVLTDVQDDEAITAVGFVFNHPEIATDAIGASMYELCLRRNVKT